MMEISRHTYEEFFLQYVDGELSDAEKKQVEEFVRLHPEYATELQLLQQTVFIPDTSVRFAGKGSLYRREKTPVHILIRRIVAAAAVILFLGTAGWLLFSDRKPDAGTPSATASRLPAATEERLSPAGSTDRYNNPDSHKQRERSSSTGNAGLQDGTGEDHDPAGDTDPHKISGVSSPEENTIPGKASEQDHDPAGTVKAPGSRGATNPAPANQRGATVPALRQGGQVNKKTPAATGSVPENRAATKKPGPSPSEKQPFSGHPIPQGAERLGGQKDPQARPDRGVPAAPDADYAGRNNRELFPDQTVKTPPDNDYADNKHREPASGPEPEYTAGQKPRPVSEKIPGARTFPIEPQTLDRTAADHIPAGGDEPQTPSYALYTNENRENDVIYFANTAIPKQNKLRGIFRTATRIIDKVTSSQ